VGTCLRTSRIEDEEAFAGQAGLTTRQALVTEKRGGGDPYSGRLPRGRRPALTVQLDYPEETALYIGLSKADLQRYAEALKRCLVLLGVRPGDTIALFEFGTSPVVYLASACYAPHLKQGAADALQCTVVCNDGIPSMSRRALDILRLVRPRYVFVRTDCLEPLLAACAAERVQLASYTHGLVVTHNDGAPAWKVPAPERATVPIYHLPRCDLALFMAVQCPACRCLHFSPDLYTVEVVSPGSLRPAAGGRSGRLVITNRFVRASRAVRVLSQLEGRLIPGTCASAPADLRLCA